MLHGLSHVTVGVPDVPAAVAFYEAFGLVPTARPGELATTSGGPQLRLEPAPVRRLVEVGIRADDPDDLARAEAGLAALDVTTAREGTDLLAEDEPSGVRARVLIAPRIDPEPTVAPAVNGPGRDDRRDRRAEAIDRGEPVRPRNLGHVVFGSTDQARSERFFAEGLGFRISDTVPGLATFLRCSTDHHNVLVQQAPAPFLHHTAWQVDDVDEVGRGALALLEADADRHVWGLGRHHVGSNYFWYLRDPAGNYVEYYADLDTIHEDDAWTPQVWEGDSGLFSWAPPPPPEFLDPVDLPELVAHLQANTR